MITHKFFQRYNLNTPRFGDRGIEDEKENPQMKRESIG
jgi:hypothetical protein